MSVTVFHNGARFEFPTLAEAKAFMAQKGHPAITKNPTPTGVKTLADGSVVDRNGHIWASEADGTCNRCQGHKTVTLLGREGAYAATCFRCKGTGKAPGAQKACEPKATYTVAQFEEVTLDLSTAPSDGEPEPDEFEFGQAIAAKPSPAAARALAYAQQFEEPNHDGCCLY